MKKLLAVCAGSLGVGLGWQAWAQLPEGKNDYRLAAVNARKAGLDADAGRGLWVARNPDLDKDGKPEILVTEYSDGGRVFVFEVTGNDQVELVWASKILTPGRAGSGSTPRSIVTGDLDNDGNQEIIFHIGYTISDTLRGLYIYEHNGIAGSDNYGAEPVARIKPEQIDATFSQGSFGRTESGMWLGDVDNDNRNELLIAPRQFAVPEFADVYIIQVKSGTWEAKNAVWEVEYEYKAMEDALNGDGYVPVGVNVANVDSDPQREIVVTGWTNQGTGAGLGFIQVNGPDAYEDGAVVKVDEVINWFGQVKGRPLVVNFNGEDRVFLFGDNAAGQKRIWVLDGVSDDKFIDISNLKLVWRNLGTWSIWGAGDQDHGSSSDGFNIYLSKSDAVLDFEYKGSGDLGDSTNYTIKQVFDIDDVYRKRGGLFNEIYVTPGLDLDADGLRDFVVSWKGSATDTIGADISLAKNSFNVFVFEWGDSTKSINLKDLATGVKAREWTVITPEDYDLAQNYPNPFRSAATSRSAGNPSTTIEFTLPLNKLISLRIFDMAGREVRTLIAPQEYSAGPHAAVWDGKDNAGQFVASGQYIYRLEFGGFVKSRTMTLLK
jgi:hypothetical protein